MQDYRTLKDTIAPDPSCRPVSTSQANDRHPAVTAHRQQRDHPTKEGQRDSAVPIWIRIQEGHQHTSQQDVRKPNVTDVALPPTAKDTDIQQAQYTVSFFIICFCFRVSVGLYVHVECRLSMLPASITTAFSRSLDDITLIR